MADFIPRPARLVIRVEDVPVLDWRLENEHARQLVRVLRAMATALAEQGPASDRELADAVMAAVQSEYVFADRPLPPGLPDCDVQADRRTVRRNVAIRCAMLERTQAEIAELCGITRAAWSFRLTDSELTPDRVAVLAAAVLVPTDRLVRADPLYVGSVPLPAEGWEEVVRSTMARWRETGELPSFDELWAVVGRI